MDVANKLLQVNTNLGTINTEVSNQAELISLVKEAVEWLPDKIPSADNATRFDAEEYSIKGKTLATIAQNIEEYSSAPNNYYGEMTPMDMAGAIVSVYDSGYEEGFSSAPKILYGTYVLKEVPTLPESSFVIDLSEFNAGSYFMYLQSYAYDSVRNIQMSPSSITVLAIDEDDLRNIYSTSSGWEPWGQSVVLGSHFEDKFKIIDFKEPVEVTKEVYEAFMGIVDNTVTTPYEIGILDNAPLIIQGRNLPVDASKYASGEVMYSADLFRNARIDNITYNCYGTDITYSATESSTSYYISFINNTRYTVYIYVDTDVTYLSDKTNTDETEEWHKMAVISPSSSTTVSAVSSARAKDGRYDWNHYLIGVRFV